MSLPSKLHVEGFRLSPTIYRETSAEGGRTHAAFTVYVRIPLSVSSGKPQEPMHTPFNLNQVLEDQLDIISSGKQRLADMGIPATYACSFKELRRFFFGKTNSVGMVYNLRSAGAMVVFGNKDASDGAASSATMRYSPIVFEQKPNGLYREMMGEYYASASGKAPATVTSTPMIRCLINTEKTYGVLSVTPPELFMNAFGLELRNGHLELEFTLVDQYTNAPRVDHPGYGG
jgi:hypothetical protein